MQFSPKIRFLILLLVLVCAAGCDQSSKHIARSELKHSGPVVLPGGFGELRLAENPGAFLSLGDSLSKPFRLALFTVVAGVGMAGLFAYLVMVGARLGLCNFIGLALIWVGGTSNLVDRITRHGLVTDFLVLRAGPFHTGIFNAADVMIMTGVALVIYHYWRRSLCRRPPGKRHEPASSTD
ncbi:MAG TPA: signal peptidase II [Verrucomicrobiae bacterium]|jgi:signal peptidase II|nr:signal peptidase II [Verrucomicrobiae bacterium]